MLRPGDVGTINPKSGFSTRCDASRLLELGFYFIAITCYAVVRIFKEECLCLLLYSSIYNQNVFSLVQKFPLEPSYVLVSSKVLISIFDSISNYLVPYLSTLLRYDHLLSISF